MSLINSNPEIASKIGDLWQKFWSGGISNPLTAIEQITYLLFMKKLDENDLKNISDSEFTGDPYISKYDGTFYLTKEDEEKKQNGIDKQELRWSQFKHKSAELMLDHVQRFVFPSLKKLDKEDSPFAKHMANAVFIIPKPSLLTEAISTIDGIYEEMEKDADVKGQDFQDIQGDVYEMLLNEIAAAGKNGQFRTPRHIIKLLAELVDPQLGQKIADPACGTGGFLLGAYQYMITQLDKNKDNIEPDEDGFIRSSRSASLTEEVKEILGNSLSGYDIDQTMVRLGLMNLMMHGIDSPKIDYKDTLSKSYNDTDEFDIVLANPPFTGNIDKGDINETLTLNTTKTELLFIQRIHNMLRTGGTAGIVLPQGVLFGTSNAFKKARKLMIEQSELKAVVSLPSGVFKPYAGVSTALLIFTKGGETENVWFYDMESDGYNLDDKRKKIKKSDKTDDYGDLQDIVNQYSSRDSQVDNDRKGKFFFVSKEEIKNEGYDLSFPRYKTEVIEDIEYENPKDIINRLNSIEKNIIDELNKIKNIF